MYMKWLTRNLLWTEGELLAGICVIAFILGWWWSSRLLMIVSIGLLLFCLYFFRNPDRICQAYHHNHQVLICPADGKIVAIERETHPEIGPVWKIAIFLSPLDVHVNWIPTDGRITRVTYRPGKFLVAYAPKSSEVNERTEIVIETDSGQRVIVRQIAGFVARRIVCWVHEGDVVAADDKYGMIKFGSRVEIMVPEKAALIEVKVGQHVFGGETVLGRWV
jgi:phosphatidylserine decarboxylase